MKRLGWIALAMVMACEGDKGEMGTPGTMGTRGTDGTDGVDGIDGTAGTNGNDVILSDRAKHGLDISPVALDLTGKTAEEIEQIGQGSYIVNGIADCDGCHDNPATGGFLAGGAPFPLDATHTVYSRNLTPDATGLSLTEAQFVETLRTGKDWRGTDTALLVMPWTSFRWMSTDDLKAIYAYLRVIPAVANGSIPTDDKPTVPPYPMPTTYEETSAVSAARSIPAETDGFGGAIPDVGNVRRGLALQPFDDPPALATMSADEIATYARGVYIVHSQANCIECHTNPSRDFSAPPFTINTDELLTGGAVFPVPPGLDAIIHQTRTMSANLIGSTGGGTSGFFATHSFPQFLGVIETGTHHGRMLGWPMPWQHFRNMSIDDLAAVYTYMKITATAYPRPNKATQHPARYCTTATVTTDCGSGESCDDTTHECVGGSCGGAEECGACQTCSTTCAAPGSTDACLTAGI